MSVNEPLQPNYNFAWVKADNTRLTKEELHNQRRQDMSEKPEALRLAQEFELHVAFGSGMTIRRTEIESVAAELRRLHAENERLTKANEELAKVNVDNLITIGRLRDAHQKVLEWVDVIKRSYREEQRAKETRGDAHANIQKISEQWLR